MTSIIKFTLKELNTLINDENSCVSKKTVTQNIAFQPWCLSNLKDSVEKIMDYKIGKFDKELNGIILSYKNVKVLDDLCAIRQDSSEIYSDVQADLYVFQPYVGANLHGVINKKSVTHLGVLVHRVFNVVIPRPSDEPGSKWIGAQASVGQKIMFKIVFFDLFGALPYIRGCLDENSLPDDNDNIQMCDELDILAVSHVNFDGTKPKSVKHINHKAKKNSGYSETVHEIHSPSLEHSNNSKTPKELKNSKSKDKSKKTLVRKYVDSDDDSISDVDDDLMKTQANMIEKIMKLDKSQRALGVRPPVGNSMAISKIDKSKPTKSTFIEVSKLKTIKKSHSKDDIIETSKINKEYIKEDKSVSSSSHKQNKISLYSSDLSNISLTLNSSKKGSSPNLSSIHKKKSKSNRASSEQNKKDDASFEIKNVPRQTVITTSTPFPDDIVRSKMKFIQNKSNTIESNDLKKKLSFSNASSDHLYQDSRLQNTTAPEVNDGADISLKNKKRKRKSSDSSANVSVIISDQFIQNKSNTIKSNDLKKKLSFSNASSDHLYQDSTLQNTTAAEVNDGVDISLKNKKRKRKSSDSSANVSVIMSDQFHSDVSMRSPHKKKRKKNHSNGDLEKVDSSNEANKHLKKNKVSKIANAQEIFSQMESDPTLLKEIQLLLKARSKKRKDK